MASRFRLNQTVLFSKVTMYSNGTTTWYSVDGHFHVIGSGTESPSASTNGWQAGYYVIVVILVYGMSIVLLIASHINRKHRKLLEDRQIDKYLKEFQVVKERSSRDSYRIMKRAIIAKLHRSGGGGGADRNSESSACVGLKSGGIYRCLSKTVLPVSTLVFPQAMSVASLGGDDDVGPARTVSSSRETLIREKALHDACLCNLYVIEEFDGEARRTPRETKAMRASGGDTLASYQRREIGREVLDQQPSGSTQNVTAEINLPQRSIRPFVVDGASSSNARTALTDDQYEVSVAVHASFELGEADAATCATNVVGSDRSRRWVRTPGPVSANSFQVNQTRRAVKQASGTSFKLQQKRAKTHSQVNDRRRSPNLVQISSV